MCWQNGRNIIRELWLGLPRTQTLCRIFPNNKWIFTPSRISFSSSGLYNLSQMVPNATKTETPGEIDPGSAHPHALAKSLVITAFRWWNLSLEDKTKFQIKLPVLLIILQSRKQLLSQVWWSRGVVEDTSYRGGWWRQDTQRTPTEKDLSYRIR